MTEEKDPAGCVHCNGTGRSISIPIPNWLNQAMVVFAIIGFLVCAIAALNLGIVVIGYLAQLARIIMEGFIVLIRM